MDIDDIRFRIAASRRMLHRLGCDSNVGGHVSARADEGGFWATGFEYFDQTTPDRVARLNSDLEVVEGTLSFSPALNFHARIYELRPDVAAVVHLHSHYISVLSSVEGKTVGMYNVGAVLFHEEQATYFDDGYKAHVSVADALGDKRVVIMKNHGAIIASDSLENATIEAAMLEQAARYHLDCEAIGGTEIALDEVLNGKRMYRLHFLPNMWESNLERLRRSDPDLFDHLTS
ncbi:MAG: class II aldolase/adducin family protein [Acidimicrobiales bacterium]|nr:class II aldolase/adducin family protein [Acidimicrobiales bacterium]